MAALVLL